MGSQTGYVCSEHFLPGDYETNLDVLRRLGMDLKNARIKRDAVPTQNLSPGAPPKKRRRSETLCANHHFLTWSSKPMINGKAAGNVLMSAAMLFAGTSPTSVLRMFNYVNVQVFTSRTFYNYQRGYLLPVIDKCADVQSSTSMKKFAFVKSLNIVKERGLKVTSVTTDRHGQVTNYMRTQEPTIRHYYDCVMHCDAVSLTYGHLDNGAFYTMTEGCTLLSA
ncbi:uncharacterized protein LOC144129728 [Amblyomma americanum]